MVKAWDEKQAPEGQEPTESRPIPYGIRPYFSLDNVPTHLKAIKDQQWASTVPAVFDDEVSPPPNSPDLHKVIEHVHANTCSAFKEWVLLRSHTPRPSIEAYFDKLKQIFYATITPKMIQDDVLSLKGTFQEVCKLGGEYPAAQYR